MPPSDKPSVKGRAAYVEEVDENGDRVRGSRRTSSKKKSDRGDRIGRSSKEKKSRSDSGYSSHAANPGSDASSPPLSRAEIFNDDQPSTSREDRPSRLKSTSGSPMKTPRKSSKPPSVHRNGDRNVDLPPPFEIPIRSKNDPQFYGVSPISSTPVTGPATRPMMMPNTSRPARPQSFHSGMPQPMHDNRPPLARSAYYIAPNPAPVIPTSFPPVSPSTWMNYPPPQQSDSYFAAQPQSRARLAERFTPQNSDPIQRTASASGIDGLAQDYYSYNGYKENSNSIRRRSKELEDLRAMPPPARPFVRRPSIRQVTTSDGRHEPSPFTPHSGELEDEVERWDRRASRTLRREDAPRRRSSVSSVSRNRAYTYEQSAPARVRIEAPDGHRKSYYEEQRPRSTNYEDKVGNAARYQEEVGGGPPVNLTAAALRQSQLPSGSSRSTRSSGSKDESDFKRSVTTRTTTSKGGQDSDDFTIRFKGAATFNIAGTEIKCGDDGAEVNIVRRKSLRNGSEQSGSEYGTVQEDRQGRGTRPVTLSRSTSKTRYSDPPFNIPWRPSHPREGWI